MGPITQTSLTPVQQVLRGVSVKPSQLIEFVERLDPDEVASTIQRLAAARKLPPELFPHAVGYLDPATRAEFVSRSLKKLKGDERAKLIAALRELLSTDAQKTLMSIVELQKQDNPVSGEKGARRSLVTFPMPDLSQRPPSGRNKRRRKRKATNPGARPQKTTPANWDTNAPVVQDALQELEDNGFIRPVRVGNKQLNGILTTTELGEAVFS